MERFVYTSAHFGALKKYSIMKILFLILGCLVLLLQSITWLVVWLRDMAITTSDMVFVGLTLVFSLYFVASQVFFGVRSKKIVQAIKQDGLFATKRVKIKFSNKSSFGGALVLFARIIAILFVILLAILIVSFIQNYLNWGKIILKMPLMVFFAIMFLNYSAELRYQTLIEQANM